jgi:4-hydroxy-3-polyprenylbenzoate decarboxylase
MTRSHKDLRAYIDVLEDAGKLRRITTPINKDTELHPLVRLQFRGLEEKDRTAFLFENVHAASGRKYDIPVLIAAMAGSADIYALGMGCTVEEIPDRWNEALDNPIDPVIVDSRPSAGSHLHPGFRQRALYLGFPLGHQGSAHGDA